MAHFLKRLIAIALRAVAATLAGVVTAGQSVSQLLPADKGEIDFVRDVQPILRNNCYKCHGPEKQKGLLRWDSKESVLVQGGQSGKEIVAGRSGESRLIQRV